MSNPPMNTPPKGGMPKWLIILLVIFMLIALGCCGGIATCIYVGHKAVQAATQATPGIVQQGLRSSGVNIDTSGAGISLPANFPSGVPVFSGMTAKSSIAPPGGKGAAVNFSGPASIPTLSDFYERELTAKGWTKVMASREVSGFTQAYSKDKQTLQIIGTESGTETSMEIIYGTGE